MENSAERIAKSFVDETRKIDSAVKSYLSLLTANNLSSKTCCYEVMNTTSYKLPQITDPKHLLSCARALLVRINTFLIPEIPSIENEDVEELEYHSLRILWNNFVKSSGHKNTSKPKCEKPSKYLGHSSLRIVYPMILSEVESTPPKILGLDEEEIISFFMYFGFLIQKFSQTQESNVEDDDSQLIWARDGGANELLQRQKRRGKAAQERIKST